MQQVSELTDVTTRFDNQVTTSILDIISSARQFVAIISPYISKIGHIDQELKLAIQRGVKVLVIVRDDGPASLGGRHGAEAIEQLRALDIDLRAVERLHSKIYMNESAAVVSSMNLLASSWNDSLEMAVALPRGHAYDTVHSYVFDKVLKLGRPLETAAPAVRSKPAASSDPATSGTRAKSHAGSRKASRSKKEEPDKTGFAAVWTAVRQMVGLGHCIRCAASIERDIDHPLCDGCYAEWARWKNGEYTEKHCHQCGKAADTSYAKPLCRSCYRR